MSGVYTSRMAAHRAAIVALLQGVPNFGLVHAEEPYAKSQAEFQALYAWDAGYGKKQVRGWFVRRVRTLERELAVGRTMNTHDWLIRGFAALDHERESGREFDELIEAARAAYRADPELGGALDPGPLAERTGIQVDAVDPVMFAGVLCHGAALRLQTYAYLDATE